MFTEAEVFAKIGFLVMALDKSQQQVQQLTQDLTEAKSTPEPQDVEETDESTGDAGGR